MWVRHSLKGVHLDICCRLEVDGPPQDDIDKSLVRHFYRAGERRWLNPGNADTSESNFIPIVISIESSQVYIHVFLLI